MDRIARIRERRERELDPEGAVNEGRSEGGGRESPLVVKRADRNPDTFVGLARRYARLDMRDRYDRYSLGPERYTLTGPGLMDLLASTFS